MKYFATLIGLFLFVATARPASPYAGEYLVIWRSYSPSSPDPELEAGADVTISADGTLTGRGAYFDQSFVTLSGKVKDSGEVAVTETDAGHIATYVIVSTYTAFFDGRRRFSTLFPDGRVITGIRVDRTRPAAGFYHAQTDSGNDAYILVERTGAVHAVVYDFDDNKTELRGHVTGDTFEASSPDDDKLAGRFAGGKVSGRYLDGEGVRSTFDGAKY